MTSYKELRASGQLEAAVRAPNLPKEPPLTGFLDALAWFAAGMPESAGTLTVNELDDFIGVQAQSYMRLLEAKVESGEDNDFSRTRTWKVIQKMTMLREEMSRPAAGGRYAFPAIAQAPDGDDPWEKEHTLDSLEEFRDKVCRASHERPVLVKFGNTNCTQCMLFELIGSVKEFAENPANKGAIDVYKVWWGFRPDESYAGKIRNPARLDDLVQAEGVKSSPTFIVYRNGRSYRCEDAFPDDRGVDERLESCVRQEFGEVPMAGSCAAENAPAGTQGR
ncbi:MAG TPA: thioredoxin family protein [Candidatus Polarisedimenticolia bacterium]|nr:thioredoxin family protein [Candidatus Polarisedimenticolia bacterium]